MKFLQSLFPPDPLHDAQGQWIPGETPGVNMDAGDFDNIWLETDGYFTSKW